MSLNLRALSNALNASDKIVLPAVHKWLIQHGDDALEERVADVIYTLLTTTPRYRGGSFSASSSGACPRARIYGYLNYPGETIDAQLANIFMDGKWRHLRWQAILLSTNVVLDVEFPLPWPRMRSVGTMDALGVVSDDHPNLAWRGKEFGFELKGVSTFQFSKYVQDGPKEDHLDQVAGYFLSSGLHLFSILYEDKTTQSTHEWVVTADNPDMKRRIATRMEELEDLNKAVDDEVLPRRLKACAPLKGATFKGCGFGGDKHGVCATVTQWPSKAAAPTTKGITP